MEWIAGLGAFGLLAACCGAKLVALLLLALRGRSAEVAANLRENPEVGGPQRASGLIVRGAEEAMEEVLQVLQSDWQDPLRCTNLEQAFHRAGTSFEDGRRRRLASAVVADAGLRDLMRWHPSAYFLTNEERLVGRVVLRMLRLRATAEDSELVE